jgi:RNA polymerase sigma-70 factor (ECF subfamily)
MSVGGTSGEAGAAERARPVVYCLVPSHLAPQLHDPLRDHFRDQRDIEVVVEQRRVDRRAGSDRRRSAADRSGKPERRQILSATGRRIGDRRAAQVAIKPPSLPRRARRHAAELTFVERLEPSTQELEDRDTARLITRFQAGEAAVFKTLYERYFDRVYAYLKVAVRDSHEAEDQTQQVFVDILEALPRYERRERPFRSWLFTITRNNAIKHLRKQRRLELSGDDEALVDESAGNGVGDAEPLGIAWISDPDLMLFVERLPLAQRQVLALRFMLGMEASEIAKILDRTPEAVRQQLSRALRLLEKRLVAVGRRSRTGDTADRRGTPCLAPLRPLRVIRERRFGLVSPGPTT